MFDDIVLITVSPPILGPHLKLRDIPLVTDTTFSVFSGEGWYLCTSVAFSAYHARHVVAFAAVINGQTALHYEYYFRELFRQYNITFEDPDEFLGVVMDFAQSQVLGFINAYKFETGRDDGIRYIKCCNVHYRRNARRFAATYATNYGKKAEPSLMRNLLRELLFTTSKTRYYAILKEIQRLYPKKKGRSFVKWYNQKNVRGTIFPAVSTMNERLKTNMINDTNAVESWHNKIYKLMHRKQQILVNLRNLCKLVNVEERIFIAYQMGVDPDYGDHHDYKPRKRARIKKYENDGRAPDTLSRFAMEYDSESDGSIGTDDSEEYDSGDGFKIDGEDFTERELEVESDDDGEKSLDGREADEEDKNGDTRNKSETGKSQGQDDRKQGEEKSGGKKRGGKKSGKKDATDPSYHNGHLIKLLRQANDSCYIDAPMELLLRSILPYFFPSGKKLQKQFSILSISPYIIL